MDDMCQQVYCNENNPHTYTHLHLTKENTPNGAEQDIEYICSSKASYADQLNCSQASCSGDHPAVLLYVVWSNSVPNKFQSNTLDFVFSLV